MVEQREITDFISVVCEALSSHAFMFFHLFESIFFLLSDSSVDRVTRLKRWNNATLGRQVT